MNSLRRVDFNSVFLLDSYIKSRIFITKCFKVPSIVKNNLLILFLWRFSPFSGHGPPQPSSSTPPYLLLQPFSSEFGAGWLHPSVWHLPIYFMVSPLAFLLQNSFLVPSLGYYVVPFLQLYNCDFSQSTHSLTHNQTNTLRLLQRATWLASTLPASPYWAKPTNIITERHGRVIPASCSEGPGQETSYLDRFFVVFPSFSR
jgi:hypothetical protein